MVNVLEVFDEYEKRFAKARVDKRLHRPWVDKEREEIYEIVKDVLKFDEEQVPEIKVLKTETQVWGGIEIRHMQFESWEHFYGVSSLYIPEGAGKRPLVIVCPGHGAQGRLSESYQRMALTLVKQGAYVLILENIGQGCRKEFGHANVPEVFYCGKTLQGLIVAEACGWIRYMKKQPYIDADKIGACGNSGGGTLTTFLCALEPTLQAIASSGYPNEFSYVLQKEKRHCDCNLLHHFAERLEMWEVYSLFAPKPLLLECGKHDQLLPVDLFQKNARKVRTTYEMLGASQNLRTEVASTVHKWMEEDIHVIGTFFADVFGLEKPEVAHGADLISHDDVHLEFPADALTTGEMVERLTGITMPKGLTLADIVKPTYKGEYIEPQTVSGEMDKEEMMRIFAQFEFSL